MRIFSMLNRGNFALPMVAPFQHAAAVKSVSVSEDGQRIYVSNFFQDGILVLDTVGPKVVGKISLKS